MEALKRYEFEVCECELGPHLEFSQVPDGEFVRFEDVKKLLVSAKRTLLQLQCSFGENTVGYNEAGTAILELTVALKEE